MSPRRGNEKKMHRGKPEQKTGNDIFGNQPPRIVGKKKHRALPKCESSSNESIATDEIVAKRNR